MTGGGAWPAGAVPGTRKGAAGPAAEDLLAIAAGAARKAAVLLASGQTGERPEVVATKSSPTDVVTEMDRRAEALITGLIRDVRPGDVILGEEAGETRGSPRPAGTAGGASAAPVRWIVDPLDGTVNYLYGLPDWAVSIAAETGGTIVAGVVDIPMRGEVFTAALGQGAWLRGLPVPGGSAGGRPPVRLHCTRDVALGQALVATGFGYEAGRRRVQGEVASALLPQIRDIRRGGSAAVDLCQVAAGRMDAFYERGLNYWDYAAGALIAREAGARVTGLGGRPPGPAMVIAAGPALHAQLTGVLTRLRPERDA
ncbi:MAG TPA: inositol monophosphatase family protein [Streptosporangiaceae bacterium]|nr:inositol monophosphatase family protein [Streptosporangiaceae bacterium]